MEDTGKGVLVPGRTCWRIEAADRVALIVDAADYFRHAKAAMLNAQHRIMLVGWDFDVRIELEPEEATLDGPNRLGEFLSWLPKRAPDLQIYLLKWDLGLFQTLGRGMTPIFIRNLLTSKRQHLRLDGVHPPGAAHHQKIIVIDDALAFCGGIDITAERWDTRQHLDSNACRVKANGNSYGPWHDATTAIDGSAARALGELVRERWSRATEERLEAIPEGRDPWPEDLAPTFEDVRLGIARTFPELGDRQEVREIEALYFAAIASARRTIYLESQYLASRKIAEALARRLREPDGPEIVLVLPKSTQGWLEQQVMDGARVALLRLLWDADAHQRFGAFYPVTEANEPIYVHAKIMVIDDTLLRVGSSNLNNRSMTFDTECDLVLEAAAGSGDDERLCKTILAVRNDLLREHLGVSTDELAASLENASGSLLETIRNFGSGRTLKRFAADDIAGDESALAENELLDPERRTARLPKRIAKSAREFVSRLTGGHA